MYVTKPEWQITVICDGTATLCYNNIIIALGQILSNNQNAFNRVKLEILKLDSTSGPCLDFFFFQFLEGLKPTHLHSSTAPT
jgi:hypothetical protein